MLLFTALCVRILTGIEKLLSDEGGDRGILQRLADWRREVDGELKVGQVKFLFIVLQTIGLILGSTFSGLCFESKPCCEATGGRGGKMWNP
jgi:hypothetical protein